MGRRRRWRWRGSSRGRPWALRISDKYIGRGRARRSHLRAARQQPEEYLRARVLGSRRNVLGILSVGRKRAGSFSSVEAANKLVNSTLSQNQARVDAFVQGRFPMSLSFMYAHADFDSPTGYEAYAPNDRSQPTMRTTYGVTVLIRRTDRNERGYYVHSAWPTNRD